MGTPGTASNSDARKRAQEATESQPIQVGDTVRVGVGKTLWTIETFWEANDHTPMASLTPLDGYSGTSAAVARLVRAESS